MSGIAADPTLLEQSYEQQVRADIEAFRSQANDFLAGTLSADDFRAARLRRGVYGQRQADVHMIRTKVPGGQLLSHQLDVMADISDEFAGGKGHLTTRQNLQYHFIPLPRVADLLHRLADARLTTREACYNTVRNVTGSPLAGLLDSEVFDVRPYMRQAAFAFLHQELTDNLPRKFKIAFAGSDDDDMAGEIHDLGFTAKIVDGRKGFRVVAGGGLGPLPSEARVLDEFLPVEMLVQRCEAVVRIFNLHGNRSNRNKARLKFVIRERGWDWFKEKVEEQFADILANGGVPVPEAVPEGFGAFESQPSALADGAALPVLNGASDPEYDRWLDKNIRRQRQDGFAIVTIRVSQGNLNSEQMRVIARLARESGDNLVRLGIDQNAHVAYVPLTRLKQVYSLLKRHSLADVGPGELDDVVTCPGAYSCNLALTKTMNLGDALSSTVREYLTQQPDAQIAQLHIRASGCPNACGQHWIGDFGFYGNARKINGKEIPYYQMLLGGGLDPDGTMRFGLAIQSIPARSAPVAMTRVLDHYRTNRQDGESFRNYVLRHKVETFRTMTADLAKPIEIAPEMYRDWGDEEEFSLQLGRGECAV
ncbi:MAG: nitrite/sulfite reductase [Acidobacteria bacterium]|nr:nitrite/sulfite reductase [Acidobacteriota bacterium]